MRGLWINRGVYYPRPRERQTRTQALSNTPRQPVLGWRWQAGVAGLRAKTQGPQGRFCGESGTWIWSQGRRIHPASPADQGGNSAWRRRHRVRKHRRKEKQGRESARQELEEEESALTRRASAALRRPWEKPAGCCSPGLSFLDNPFSFIQSLKGSNEIVDVNVIWKF